MLVTALALRAYASTQTTGTEAGAAPIGIKLSVDGQARQALIFNHSGAAARPLVIVLHGADRSNRDIFDLTDWPTQARTHGFVLIAPQGQNKQWNDGREQTASGHVSHADDVAFIESLIAFARSNYQINPRRVFLAGISNGGLMTFRFGCEHPEQLTAIAPSIAKLPRAVASSCKPKPALPLFLTVGTADPLMAYQGAPTSRFARGLDANVLMSVPETLAFWSTRNHCNETRTSRQLPHLHEKDSTSVTRIDYLDCPADGQVSALIVQGGGHREPTLHPARGGWIVRRVLGLMNHDVETAAVVWQFFSAVPDRDR